MREWIKTHQPDEAVPDEIKNDRLFDTWQEYGCIEVNPQTNQAVWYVMVRGTEPEGNAKEAAAGMAWHGRAGQGRARTAIR